MKIKILTVLLLTAFNRRDYAAVGQLVEALVDESMELDPTEFLMLVNILDRYPEAEETFTIHCIIRLCK